MFLMMLINLATVLGRRLVAPKPGNLAFIFNHTGLTWSSWAWWPDPRS